MPTIIMPYQKKRRKMIVVLVVIIILIILIWYFGSNPAAVDLDGLDSEGVVDTTINDNGVNYDIDTDIFKDPRFAGLEAYVSGSLEPECLGRSNPFLPY